MQTKEIDELLRRAAEAGDVPGVVAMATTADGTIYAVRSDVDGCPTVLP